MVIKNSQGMEEAVSTGKDREINFEFNKEGILKNQARARINTWPDTV